MKKLIFLLVLLPVAATSQTVVIDQFSFAPFQDSLFLFRTIKVTESNFEGVNDTIIDNTVYDTLGLQSVLYTLAENHSNQNSALLRRAFPYRTVRSVQNEYATLAASLGGDLDSFYVAKYWPQLQGRYRYVDSLGAERFFDLIEHPSRVDRLRFDEDGGANENLNVTVEGRWKFTVRLDNQNQTFEWTGEDRDRPKFHRVWFWLPGVYLPFDNDNRRFVKIN